MRMRRTRRGRRRSLGRRRSEHQQRNIEFGRDFHRGVLGLEFYYISVFAIQKYLGFLALFLAAST